MDRNAPRMPLWMGERAPCQNRAQTGGPSGGQKGPGRPTETPGASDVMKGITGRTVSNNFFSLVFVSTHSTIRTCI